MKLAGIERSIAYLLATAIKSLNVGITIFGQDARSWLESWLRSWLVEAGRKALSAQPDTITLRRVPGAKWRDPAAAKRLLAPLREKGFIDLGLYEIQPRRGFRLGIMLNERDNVAAFLTELPTGTITLELSVRYVDGTTTSLVNYADNGVPRPPFFRVTFAGPNASSSELYDRLLRERTTSGIKTITADYVIVEYQAAYAKIMTYVKGRGLSANEVAEIAGRARRPATGLLPAPKPAPDSGEKHIQCPHCGRLNERQREVCWACYKLLSGSKDKLVAEPVPYEDQTYGTVPAPVREQLGPDERVLWHGQPQDKFDFREVPGIALLMTWVGGVLFGGIGVAVLYAYFFKAPSRVELWAVSLLLFGIVFLITGVYILFGPWLQRLVRRRTFYAVTDRRVIIVNERPWHRVVALDLERLVSARVLLETADGSGDIELLFGWGATAYPAFWMENDFEFIGNVREVETLLLLARSQAALKFVLAPATQWPSGILGQDVPKALAWLNVLILYFCVAFYPILICVDLRELSRLGVSAFAPPPAHSDHSIFSPASEMALAPFMMFFLYSRARKFQSETRVARYFDVAVAVIFAVLGGVLLTSEAGFNFDAGGRTGGFVILGLFALLLARGRAPQAE